VSEIAEFLRARYTEARDKETRKQSVRGDLPFQWTAVYSQDDPHVMLGEFHRIGMDEFFEKYGESAADPGVLADLDAKLALVDDLLAERHQVVEDCWWTCAAATEERDGGETCHDARIGSPCDCGRDERVNRRLGILAQPFVGHPEHKGEEWAP